jgi:hypothetical protein
MPLHISFVEFHAPQVARRLYSPAATVPLPLVVADRLTVQATLHDVFFDVEELSDVQLGLCRANANGYELAVPDFLPVDIQIGANRAWVNRQGAKAIPPGLTPGCYALGLYAGDAESGFRIFAVSNPVLYSVLEPATLRLRYRNNVPAFGFTYWDVNYYHYLRLPLALHSAAYEVQDVQTTDAEGRTLPVFARIQKYYTLAADYLTEHLAEALQLALKHSDFQLLDESTQQWHRYAAAGALQLQWTGNPELPLCTATARLQDAEFAAINASFINPA